MGRDFFHLFPEKSVIGMIHLAGRDGNERVERALEEISIYEEEGVHGVIVEDYHGTTRDVANALSSIKKRGTSLITGVNFLSYHYSGFSCEEYGVKFVQLDSVQPPFINVEIYNQMRILCPKAVVLGGIRFKHIRPSGKSLEEDICGGMSRCEAIVTTGEGTGLETPTEKLREFRRVMGKFPLVVGAGINDVNIREQMEICDAAIVGSYFKNGDTTSKVSRGRVRRLMVAMHN